MVGSAAAPRGVVSYIVEAHAWISNVPGVGVGMDVTDRHKRCVSFAWRQCRRQPAATSGLPRADRSPAKSVAWLAGAGGPPPNLPPSRPHCADGMGAGHAAPETPRIHGIRGYGAISPSLRSQFMCGDLMSSLPNLIPHPCCSLSPRGRRWCHSRGPTSMGSRPRRAS